MPISAASPKAVPCRRLSRRSSARKSSTRRCLKNTAPDELKQGALRMEHPCDYHIAEHFAQPRPAPGMELKDAFLFAADREKASHEFYLKLAQLHVAGETRALLEKLASQELEHKAIVESLFTEVAFPQTDGG